MKAILYFMMLVLCVWSIEAYTFGYGEYGMNHSKADRIKSMIPVELFEGLDKLTFTNSLCVYTKITFYNDSYQTDCHKAHFEFWTMDSNRITIGDFDNRDEREVLADLLHELGHLDKWRSFGWEYHYHDEAEMELYAELFEKYYLISNQYYLISNQDFSSNYLDRMDPGEVKNEY